MLLPHKLSCPSPGRGGQACFHMTLQRERNVSRLWRVWSLLGWNRKHRVCVYVFVCVCVCVCGGGIHTPTRLLFVFLSYLGSSQKRNLKTTHIEYTGKKKKCTTSLILEHIQFQTCDSIKLQGGWFQHTVDLHNQIQMLWLSYQFCPSAYNVSILPEVKEDICLIPGWSREYASVNFNKYPNSGCASSLPGVLNMEIQ